eukprot:TRINITY_DN5324_c0_g1_i1.p1 TRINITY_DN5324_c0_g1~~TRINITY_DN5324_c0_g1_i1.p1  ORF type:complete len:617 (+),score=172.41 TRINITY_DN5324_c0_g1_i1:584-2434(+)
MKDPINLPESIFAFSTCFIVFAHNELKIVAICPYSSDADKLRENYAATAKKISELEDRLTNGVEVDFAKYRATASNRKEAVSNIGKEGYEKHVTTLKQHIVDGDIIQAVPSQRLARPIGGIHPFQIYEEMRVVNPSSYMFYFELEDFQLVGASPELLVKVDVTGTVVNHPIAGTRKRGNNEEEDLALEKELLADEKERAEHIMLVDLGRNDVNRVCEPHSTKVDSLMHIERYSHVMHIVSQVSGKLRSECSIFDAFRSIFPAGTVSGAPKIKAMELIATLENEKRGVYAGSFGYFTFLNSVNTCIAIRTLVSKNGVAYLQAGGGIVHDSVPFDEYIETVNKMGSVARSIDLAESKSDSNQTSTFNPAAKPLQDSNQKYHREYLELWASYEKAAKSESLKNQVVSVPRSFSSKINNKLLMIDNYDSFTWNLYQYLSQIGQNVLVFRNDEITVAECLALGPDRVVISPGPSWPKDAGISSEVMKAFGGKVPVLGVCLGHECMVEILGGLIEHCGEIKHGKSSIIEHDGKGIYQNIPNEIEVIRYHSLAMKESSVLAELAEITARSEITTNSEEGIIQGLRHKKWKMEGLQYHPESIKTQYGMEMLKNFAEWNGGCWDS